jgi:RNA polymerase sigma factor (sigma-70 family)
VVRVRRNRLWPVLEGKCQADDVVQEIWARVVSGAKKNFTPSGPGSFLAFLGKVTERTMVDLLRTASAKKRGGGENLRSLDSHCERSGRRLPGVADAETPTSRARVSELEDVARRGLTRREFEAWELVEMQDYSAAEAGLAMDCSGSAVRGLILRGRAKLILALGEE